jgi:hypothetical protein
MAAEAAEAEIAWDDSRMRSSFANACSVVGTRGEVVLSFGIADSVASFASGAGPQPARPSRQVILTPPAARRLAALLDAVVDQHESRGGRPDAAAPGKG